MTRYEREKLLKLKVKVMRRAGLTVESVERNAEISRQNLLRNEEVSSQSAPRLLVAS